MPVLLVGLLRTIIMAAMNTAVVSSAFLILDKGIEWITGMLMNDEGMSRDEAEDTIASETLAVAGAVGADAALIKSRLPMRIADRLQKPLKQSTLTPSGTVTGGKGVVPAKLGILKALFGKSPWVIFGTSVLTSIPWWPSLVQNFLDQGTFNPVNANRAMAAIGLGGVFQWPVTPKELQPGSYTATEFVELFNQLSVNGATVINNTFERQSQVFDKGNLAQLVNAIVGTLIMQGKPSKKADILKELPKYINTSGAGGVVSTYSPSPAKPSTPATPVASPVKIFTGIVASGVLGVSRTFESATDGYIDSDDDLKATASQTLANFVLTLPAQFKYEIGIVSTFRSPGGFSQKGEMVKVVSSYLKDGTPKYKTLYKKFAVLKVYIFDQNGRKIILLTENMGQVNSTDYTPSIGALSTLANKLTSEIFTTDVGEIKQTATAPQSSVPPIVPAQQITTPPSTPAPAGYIYAEDYSLVPKTFYPPQPATTSTPSPYVAPTPPPPVAVRSLTIGELLGQPAGAYIVGGMTAQSLDDIGARFGTTGIAIKAANSSTKIIKDVDPSQKIDMGMLQNNWGVPAINIPIATVASDRSAAAWKTNTGAENLNVRATVGTSSAIADKLPNGSPVTVLEGAGAKDGYSWLKISYNTATGPRVGYVADQFLVRV